MIEHSDAERMGHSGVLQRQQALAVLRASRLHNRLAATHCSWGAATPAGCYQAIAPASESISHGGRFSSAFSRPAREPAPSCRSPWTLRLRQTRRRQFWSTLLAIPEVAIEVLPEKLLPADRDGQWPVCWWHRLYMAHREAVILAAGGRAGAQPRPARAMSWISRRSDARW